MEELSIIDMPNFRHLIRIIFDKMDFRVLLNCLSVNKIFQTLADQEITKRMRLYSDDASTRELSNSKFWYLAARCNGINHQFRMAQGKGTRGYKRIIHCGKWEEINSLDLIHDVNNEAKCRSCVKKLDELIIEDEHAYEIWEKEELARQREEYNERERLRQENSIRLSRLRNDRGIIGDPDRNRPTFRTKNSSDL